MLSVAEMNLQTLLWRKGWNRGQTLGYQRCFEVSVDFCSHWQVRNESISKAYSAAKSVVQA
jgi:hypothetical protein